MESIDIILPAFNPNEGWEDIVIKRFLSMRHQLPGFRLNLIIVNDGSTRIDEAASLQKLRSSLPEILWITYSVNHGKGYALRQGVSKSEGDYIIYTDIDWPYEEKSMLLLIHTLFEHADAVIGVRNDAYYEHLPPARRRISRMLKFINGRLLRLKVNDTQAGLKGFRQQLKSTFLKTTINRYLFDLEFIYLLSSLKNVNVKSIPISLRQGITFSRMNRRILIDEAKNFLRIWLRS